MTEVNSPTLYQTGSSYYSMIARFVLAEKNISYISKIIDIHVNLEQFKPEYARLNPNLTIPTLLDGDTIITSSKEILFYVDNMSEKPLLQPSNVQLSHIMHEFIELHYQIQIENLTFGRLLQSKRLLRRMFTKALLKEIQLINMYSKTHPELVGVYATKKSIVETRLRQFDPVHLQSTYESARHAVSLFIQKMDAQLQHTRWLAGDDFSLADIVAGCLLARLVFCHEGELLRFSSKITDYTTKITSRQSFHHADIWTSMRLSMLFTIVAKKVWRIFRSE